MAGIGFRLQKLLSGESYTDLIKAYLFSAIIMTGPLLVVLGTVALVKFVSQSRLTIEEGNLLMGLVVYVFAYSMLGVSPFLYVVTRYLADKYYYNEVDAYAPTYISLLGLAFLIQGVLAVVFLWTLPAAFIVKWAIFSLYLFVSGIWIAMIFLSAAQNYFWIVMAFVGGGVVGTVSAIVWGNLRGFSGFLNGFTLGQGITFFILTIRIFIEFGCKRGIDFGFFSYFKKYPYLVWVGVFYYFGIWVDKFVFWYSPKGRLVRSWVRVFSEYDTPMFLAFLTIVPSMAFFMIQMETSFFRRYRGYYGAIRNRDDLQTIRERKQAVLANLSSNFQKFALFQGTLSGFVILFIYQIGDAFSLNPLQMGILRVGILGAFLQMGYIMILNILFYFDFQKEACLITLVYMICNGLFTFTTYKIGLPAYGFGYATAAFVTLLFGFFILDRRLKNIDYWTFMRQPIVVPKFKFEGEGT